VLGIAAAVIRQIHWFTFTTMLGSIAFNSFHVPCSCSTEFNKMTKNIVPVSGFENTSKSRAQAPGAAAQEYCPFLSGD
jgi:hypothetical protein